MRALTWCPASSKGIRVVVLEDSLEGLDARLTGGPAAAAAATSTRATTPSTPTLLAVTAGIVALLLVLTYLGRAIKFDLRVGLPGTIGSREESFVRKPDSVAGFELLAVHYPAGSSAPVTVHAPDPDMASVSVALQQVPVFASNGRAPCWRPCCCCWRGAGGHTSLSWA